MNYKKQDFRSNQLLKAQHLNHLEDGLSQVFDSIENICPKIELEENLISCYPVEDFSLNLESHIEGIQKGEGTPTPELFHSIYGHNNIKLTRCGKNLLGFEDFDVTSQNDVYSDSCRNGVLTRTVNKIHTPSGFLLNTTIPYIKSNYFPSGTYVFTVNQSSTGTKFSPEGMKIKMELADGTTIYLEPGVSKTIAHSGKITAFEYNSSAGNFNAGDVITYTIQLEKNNIASEHEVYRGDTHVAEFGHGVYKGNLNWQTGELTTEWEYRVLDGTEDWQLYNYTENSYYYLSIGAKFTYAANEIICSHYAQASIANDNTLNGVNIVNSSQNEDRLIFRPDMSAYDTRAKWKAFLAAEYEAKHPVTVAYQRTEPLITKLEPQNIFALEGLNNIWSDTGKTKVSSFTIPAKIIEENTEKIENLKMRTSALESAFVNNV